MEPDESEVAPGPGMSGYDCPDGEVIFGSRRVAEELEQHAMAIPEFRKVREAEREFSALVGAVLHAVERLPAQVRESGSSIFYGVAMIPAEANSESSRSAVSTESRGMLREIRKRTSELKKLLKVIEALQGPFNWGRLQKLTAALNAYDGLVTRLKANAPAIAKAASARSPTAKAEARGLLVKAIPAWGIRKPSLPAEHVLDQWVERIKYACARHSGKPSPKTIRAAARQVAVELLARMAGLSSGRFEKLLPPEPP